MSGGFVEAASRRRTVSSDVRVNIAVCLAGTGDGEPEPQRTIDSRLEVPFVQLCEKAGQEDHGNIRMVLERQKMAIPRDHILRLYGNRTFQNPIVRFVFKNVEGGSWTKNSRHVADLLNGFPHSVFRPVELCLKDSGCSVRIETDGKSLKCATDRLEDKHPRRVPPGMARADT